MTMTRTLCPLCDWHYDQDEPDFTQPQPFASEPAPEGVDPLIWGYSLGRTLVVENALKAHLETHTLLEWVTALTTAQRQLAAQAGTCDASASFDALATVGPCILRRHHEGPVHKAANGATWSQVPSPDDLPELTAEDAVEAMQDMAGDLYRAEDRLAFVREMCDAADRDGKQVTTEQVRAWLQYTGCGGTIELPEDEQQRLKAAMALHSLTGRIIDEAQRDRWQAAGRCGICGFDGDRAGCQDCVERSPGTEPPAPSS